jgi:hypothetical protein
MHLTEKQRQDAIASCERIEVLLERQQQVFQNINRIFENLAAGRDPKDGVKEIA